MEAGKPAPRSPGSLVARGDGLARAVEVEVEKMDGLKYIFILTHEKSPKIMMITLYTAP